MIKNSVLKGVFLVGLGATSYGMLATFVKIAYGEGFTTPEVTIAQFVYGITGMLLITMFQKSKKGNDVAKASTKNISQLVLAGTSLGMTSIFYYLAVKYIPVSIAIDFRKEKTFHSKNHIGSYCLIWNRTGHKSYSEQSSTRLARYCLRTFGSSFLYHNHVYS